MPDVIQPSTYWNNLGPVDTAALTAAGVAVTFSAGEILLAQADTTGDVLILVKGFVKVVVRMAAGITIVLALRGPGDIIGELAHIAGGVRSASVAAITEVRALRVPYPEFRALLGRSANASTLLQRTVVDRLREADRDRLAAASMTVGQRLARLLLKLCRYGVPGAEGGVTVALLSQKELAAYVGGAQRTVANKMADWRKRHILSTRRLSVTIHQPALLARIAGPASPPP